MSFARPSYSPALPAGPLPCPSARCDPADDALAHDDMFIADRDDMGAFSAQAPDGPASPAQQGELHYIRLEHQRPDVASLARFASSVEIATFHMCVAFEQAGVRDFKVETEPCYRHTDAKITWIATLADTTFCRFRTLRRALTHDWTPPVEVEPLTYTAFRNLCDLTPTSGHYLKQLFFLRRDQAIDALVKQLDLIAELLEKSVGLARAAEETIGAAADIEKVEKLAADRSATLQNAGEALGLREAAARLGMSHQNLHKRIGAHSALGVMQGSKMVVPSIQIVETGDGAQILPGLKPVLRMFADAEVDQWTALNYLVELDPSLGAVPIELLKEGETERVIAGVRSHVGFDVD